VFRGQRRPGKRWLKSDTLLASALLLYEDSLNDLGIPRYEAMDPLNDGDNPARTGEFVVSPPLRDHAITALERARKRVADAETPWPEALRMGVHLEPIVRPEPIGG
jgi:hypothetical protein